MNSVVTFHNVSDANWCDEVLCFLKSRYDLVSIDTLYDLYKTPHRGSDVCHITVDDGDNSFCDIILPVLQKHNAPASVFVSPLVCEQTTNYWFQEIQAYNPETLRQICARMLGLPFNAVATYSIHSILKTMTKSDIDKAIMEYQITTGTAATKGSNMTVEQLIYLTKDGLVTIGAHTMSHPILHNEDDSTSEYEICESVNRLSVFLGQQVRYFAYPNGIPSLDFSAREEAYLWKSGVRLAFTTESGHWSPDNNPMRIPRVQISDRESVRSIKAKLLFGSNWNTMKRLKPTGEYAERRRLVRMLRANDSLDARLRIS